MPTPKQLLLEHQYDGDVPADIKAALSEGRSWRDIAQDISEQSGVRVSHESLRQWYGEASTAGAA